VYLTATRTRTTATFLTNISKQPYKNIDILNRSSKEAIQLGVINLNYYTEANTGLPTS
jgi:hypothetical protein